MRAAWLAVAGSLAACFRPTPPEGFACGPAPDRWCPPPLTCASDGTCRSSDSPTDGPVDDFDAPRLPDADPSKSNLAFVAATPLAPKTLGPPASADAMCTTIAHAAGHQGTFVAWLSTVASPVATRLGSARGWVRTDGRPFADAASDLEMGRFYYPLRLDENQVDRQVVVMTGTNANGGAGGEDCVNYTSGSTNDLILVGASDATAVRWTSDDEGHCDGTFSYYCLQIDHDFALPAPNDPGPRVFLSDGKFDAATGLGTADKLCQNEADAHTLGGSWFAFLSTTSESALTHVGGPPLRPWVRLDGIAVTRTFVALDAPVVVTPQRDYVDDGVWSGSKTANQPAADATESCANWSAAGVTGLSGSSSHSNARAFGASSAPCNGPRRVYCVEKSRSR